MKKVFFVSLFIIVILSFISFSQVAGDYRSNVTGSVSLWSAASSWETYNGANWLPASTPPTSTSNVTIVAEDTLVLDIDVTFATLILEDPSQLNMSTPRTINGDLMIHGTFAVSGGITITVSGNVTCSGPNAQLKFSSNSGHIQGVIGKVFTLSNGATLTTSTNITVAPGALPATVVDMTWVIDNSLANTTVIFKNGGNSTYFGELPNGQVLGNVRFATAGSTATKTYNFGSDFTIMGNLIFAPQSTVGETAIHTYNLAGFKIRTLGTDKSVTVSQLSATGLVITGTADSLFNGFSNCNFILPMSTNCTVNYASPNAQVVAGGTYQDLNLSGGGQKSLADDVIVNDTLTLNSGNLLAGTNTLTLGSASTMVRTSEYIIGNLAKNISTGPTSSTFEIGTANGYSPVTVVFANVTAADNLTVGATETTHPNATIPANTLQRYWSISGGGSLAFDNYSATFTYLPIDFNTGVVEATDEGTLVVGKYLAGWTFPTINARIAGGTTDGGTIEVTGLTSFSDFAIGKADGISSVERTSSIPEMFYLSQNYPNPFNPATSISFSIPQSTFVTLKVYDVIGKEIATLVNGEQIAGIYNVNFDASELSSGVYLYRLSTPNSVITKKMILIK